MNEYGNRRAVLFDDFDEAERMEKLTTSEILESGLAANVAGNTNVVSAQVASATQIRLLGYKYGVIGAGSVRAHVVASTTSSASIIDRDYRVGEGTTERKGEGWQNPYRTHEMSADGSLHLRAVPVGATVGSVHATLEAQTQRREPPGDL